MADIEARMNVVSYIRVSSKSQLDGDGPERQRDVVSKFCSAHKLSLRWEAFERGVSGTTEALDREAFSGMIELIDQRKSSPDSITAVVVERMDRLARDLIVSEMLLRELRKRGIKVFAADQDALIDMASDEGDPTRKLIRQIMGALAEWEKSQLVLKLRVAKQRAKAAGKHVDGTRPYGCTLVEETILGLMKTWRAEGVTHERIAYLLNAGDFRTRKGSEWTRQAVRDILHNQGIK